MIQASMCLHPKLRVPPTVTVNRSHVVRDARRAAATAIDALDEVRDLGDL